MSQEIEIRFAVRPDDLARLGSPRALKGYASGRPTTRRLSTVYYDTQDLALSKAGLSLRVRKTGRIFVQTVKNESTGALASERGEFESEIPTAEPRLDSVPDEEMRERLHALANNDPI